MIHQGRGGLAADGFTNCRRHGFRLLRGIGAADLTPVYGIIPVYPDLEEIGPSMRSRTAVKPREAETHRLIAGDPALDFANTLNGHARRNGHEYLRDFTDLALWCKHAGILTPSETRGALSHAARHPSVAGDLYRRALGLREAIFRVYHAIAVGAQPPEADIQFLSKAWREAQGQARITQSGAGFALGWDEAAILERIPRRLSSAAVATLVSEKTSRIKACDGEGCDWLFVDSSRNHLRRWCSMDECGNRAKMRRRQRKQRAQRNRTRTGGPRGPTRVQVTHM